MSKNNNSTIKVDREEDFVRIYQHANFGEKVEIFGHEAVIAGFEKFDDGMNAKCYYKEGGFDWINRDDLEDEMEKVLEKKLEDKVSDEYQGDEKKFDDIAEYGEKARFN